MATAVLSKKTLSNWFSNKSFVLSVHRLHLHSKQQSTKDELQQLFRRLDANSNGKIEGFELRSYLSSIGELISPKDAQVMINDLDAAGDDNLMLDFEDFEKLMEREGGGNDLKRGFEMFAVKGSGFITTESLQRMFSALGYKISNEECKTVIQVFDLNGDGVLDFSEFQQLMA